MMLVSPVMHLLPCPASDAARRAAAVGRECNQDLAAHTSPEPVPDCQSSLPAAMLHQPRVPPTGQRQATEIVIKWREVLAQKNAFLEILSRTTGHSAAKLDKVRGCISTLGDAAALQAPQGTSACWRVGF